MVSVTLPTAAMVAVRARKAHTQHTCARRQRQAATIAHCLYQSGCRLDTTANNPRRCKEAVADSAAAQPAASASSFNHSRSGAATPHTRTLQLGQQLNLNNSYSRARAPSAHPYGHGLMRCAANSTSPALKQASTDLPRRRDPCRTSNSPGVRPRPCQ